MGGWVGGWVREEEEEEEEHFCPPTVYTFLNNTSGRVT